MDAQSSKFLNSVAVLCVLLLWIAGCATHHPTEVLRVAMGAPTQFYVEASQGLTPPNNPGASPSKLVDPRNGTQLQLLRSVNGIGDYQAPPGTYGLGERELLRVDSFGKPLGIVRR